MTGPGRHDESGGPGLDTLRLRLEGLDPTRPGGPAFVREPTPDHLQELIMTATSRTVPTAEDQDTVGAAGAPRSRTRVRWYAVAAALVVVAGITGVLALRVTPPTVSPGPRSLALTVPGGNGPVSSSCAPFDVRLLRDMPVAFAGTVTSVTDDQVSLDVTRWYAGSPAQRRANAVSLDVPGPNTSAALDGVTFRAGQTYLLAATNGTVNGCGFSGPATAELEAAYAEAFGS